MSEQPLPCDEDLRIALATSGAVLASGLSDGELAGVEETFGFSFPPDYRRLLTLTLPLGDHWPDWRAGDEADLGIRLAWPVEGVLFDVEHNGFWHPDWPSRPEEPTDALVAARGALVDVPPLVPVYGHRYLPAVPSLSGNPVLSVYQTDIIYYGNDLLDWFGYEFRRSSVKRAPRRVPFWSWLIEGE